MLTRPRTLLLAALLLLFSACSSAIAQTAHFGGVQTAVVSGASAGLSYPAGMAIDPAGNLYIADTENNRILKETVSAGVYSQTIIASHLSLPAYIALDATGNVYFTNYNNVSLQKLTLSGGAYTVSTIARDFSNPQGVAVDAAGNVFVADNSSGIVYKFVLSNGNYLQTIAISTGLRSPSGLRVDSNDSLYIADTGNGRIAQSTQSGNVYATPTTLVTLAAVNDLALDSLGNLAIATNSGFFYAANIAGTYSAPVLMGSNFNTPLGVAFNAANTPYVVDTNNQRVVQQVLPQAQTFGSVQDTVASASQTLAFVFDTAGTLNGSAPTQALTQGSAGTDFTIVSGGTCANTASYAVNATCTVNAQFAPAFPGERGGAVLLNGSSGAVAATAFLNGVGLGPQVAFAPITSSFGSGLSSPTQLAVDGAGDVFVIDTNNGRLVKETPSGGSYVQSVVTTSLYYPKGVAVDPAGNLYVGDFSNRRLVKLTLTAGSYVLSTIGSTRSPAGVAVDTAGNVYTVDFTNNVIYKMTLTPAGYVQSSIGSGLNQPLGVTVDPQGNLYIADTSNSRIVKETFAAGVYTQSVLSTAFSYPEQISIDPYGNLYVADEYDGLIKLTLTSSGAYMRSTISESTQDLQGVTADSSGDLYYTGVDSATVSEQSVTAAPALVFPSTPVGTFSAALSFALSNIGNQPLSILNSGPSANSVFQNTTAPTPACPYSGSVAAGTTCNFAFDFYPSTVGPSSFLSTLQDTSLNMFPAAQTIALSGTATQGPQVITFNQPATPIVYTGSTENLTVSATSSSGLAVRFTITATAPTSSNSQNSPATIQVRNTGTITITATQAGNANFAAAANVTRTIQVVAAPPTGYTATATPVGSSSIPTATLMFTAAATLNTGAATAIQALTLGSPNLDYTVAGGGTCTAGSAYAVNQTCTVNVIFAPRFAGQRAGAVVLADGNGNPVATAYLQGVGQGPQVGFTPVKTVLQGLGTNPAGATTNPIGVVADGAGNLYITDIANEELYKAVPGPNGYTLTVLDQGFYAAGGLAIDGAGVLYVADSLSSSGGPGSYYKETPGGGTYTRSVILSNFAGASTNNFPLSVAVDAQGNLFLGAAVNQASSYTGVVEEAALSGGTYTLSQLATTARQVFGIGVDAADNVYAAAGGTSVLKETLSNGTYTASNVSGFTSVTGVAIDLAGNLFVDDNGTSLKEVPASGGPMVTLGSGFANALEPFVDGAGDIIVPDYLNHRVLEFPVTSSTLAFPSPSTPTGTTSTPLSTTLTNLGNQPLTLPVPSTGMDPNTAANFVLETNADTTCPVENAGGSAGTLAPNAMCTLSYVFAPAQVGTLTSTSILTDDNLNAAAAMQSITLTGVASQGTQTAQTISFPQPVATNYPGSAMLNATATSGLPVTYTVTSGPATVSGSTLTYTGPGTVVVMASQAGNVQYAAAPSVSITITVAQAQQNIVWQPSTLKLYTGAALTSSILDATNSIPGTIAYTAALQPAGSANMVGASTVLAQGIYNLTATITPSDTQRYGTTTDTLLFTVQNMNVFFANAQGSIASLYNNGTQQSGPVTGGGIGAAVDSGGSVWSINATGSGLTKVTNAGASSAMYNNVAGINAATALAIDGGGTVWVTNGSGTISAVNNAGTAATSVPVAAAARLSSPASVSVDTAGSLWIANAGNNTVTEIIGVAVPVNAPLTAAVVAAAPATRP